MPSASRVKASPEPSLLVGLQRLYDVEAQSELLRHTVDGWSAWPLVRFEVSLLLSGLTFPRRSVVSRGAQIRRAIGDLPRLSRLRPARHIVQTYSSGLMEWDGEHYVDTWFDDVIMAAGSTFKIETLNNPDFGVQSRRARVPRDMSGALIEVAAALVRQAGSSPDVAPVSRRLSRTLQRSLHLREADEEWVARRLRRFSALRSVYAAILRQVSPSYVLVVSAGHHALMAAARERGATVLEFQHGIADRSNAAYAWTAAAAHYRPTMPIPDRLLLYGDFWKSELARSGFWGDRLRVVGSPRVDRYRNAPRSRDSARQRILFTTQGFAFDRVTRFLARFLDHLGPRSPFQLVIKLHPIYDVDRRPYEEAFARYGGQVAIIAGNEQPSTLDLLLDARLHVSIASASHYDAVSLGVPTAILPFGTHETILPLWHAGHASVASTPESLAAIARDPETRRPPRSASEYYFRSGARANILRELGLGGYPVIR
jgi:hypothetical protein